MKTTKVYRILNNSIRTGNCSITKNGKVKVYPNEAFGVVHVCTTLESLTEWIIALGASILDPWYVDNRNPILIGKADLPCDLVVNVVKNARRLDQRKKISVKLESLSEEKDLTDIMVLQKVEFTPFWINPRKGYVGERIEVSQMDYDDWENDPDFCTKYNIDDIEFEEATVKSIYSAVPTAKLPMVSPSWKTIRMENLDNWTPIVHLFGESDSTDESVPNLGYYMEKSFGSSLDGTEVFLMVKEVIEPFGFIHDSAKFGHFHPRYNRRRFSPDGDWEEYSEMPLADARKLFWDWAKGYDERLLSDILDEIFPDGYWVWAYRNMVSSFLK